MIRSHDKVVFGIKTGFSIVELVVAGAIIVTIGTGAIAVWQQYLRVTQSSAEITQSALLTEEAAEAVEIMRDTSWSRQIAPLPLNTTYYLHWNGSSYATSTTPAVVNTLYAVSFSMSSVYRDANATITSSGGSLDAHSRNVTVYVTTLANPAQIIAQSTFVIHDLYQN